MALALAACALIAAGCGSGANTTSTAQVRSGPAPSTAPATTSSTATTPAGSTSATSTTSTTGGAAVAGEASARCAPVDLGIHFAGSQGAAGHIIETFEFVNVTRHACSLFGYPGMAAYDAGGRALPVTVAREASLGPPIHVEIPRGGHAGFLLETGTLTEAGACELAAHLRFTPPDDTSTVEIAHSLRICGRGHVVSVTPVGRTG